MCIYIYFDIEKIEDDYHWDEFILSLDIKTIYNNKHSIDIHQRDIGKLMILILNVFWLKK
jgi:hypothetical protein